MSAEILSRVTRVITLQLGVEVKPGSSLVADLGADSLDLVEVTMAIEDEFNIVIPDEDVEPLHTVQQWCDYVVKRGGT